MSNELADLYGETRHLNLVIPTDWAGSCVNYRLSLCGCWVSTDGHVLGLERVPGDYPRVRVGTTLKRVHIMALEAWHGLRPSKKHRARHLDGDPQNCAASNLRWGTHRENVADWRYHRALERHGLTRDIVPYERPR